MIRFDFACKKCEKQFTLWSDDGKVCPHCASKRIMKIFLTPPAYSTGNSAAIDKAAEANLNAAGFSNYTNYGGQVNRTRKTDPKELEAIAAAKANNVPIVTGPNGRVQTAPALAQQLPLARMIGARGRGHITQTPQGQGGMVQNLMQHGKRLDPLAARSERIFHKDAASESAALKGMLGK